MTVYEEKHGTLGFNRPPTPPPKPKEPDAQAIALGTLEAYNMSMGSKANDRQVGGQHYKKGGEEHWDRAWRLKYDPFQYIITKWVERWRDKGGIQDLRKAHHALEKYIETVEAEQAISDPLNDKPEQGTEPEPNGYVSQDRGSKEVPRRTMANPSLQQRSEEVLICGWCEKEFSTIREFANHVETCGEEPR